LKELQLRERSVGVLCDFRALFAQLQLFCDSGQLGLVRARESVFFSQFGNLSAENPEVATLNG
jgi:hypothetical protein